MQDKPFDCDRITLDNWEPEEKLGQYLKEGEKLLVTKTTIAFGCSRDGCNCQSPSYQYHLIGGTDKEIAEEIKAEIGEAMKLARDDGWLIFSTENPVCPKHFQLTLKEIREVFDADYVEVKHDIERVQAVYDDEINFSISCFWDAGFDIVLGDHANGIKGKMFADTFRGALKALIELVDKYYPDREGQGGVEVGDVQVS